MKNSNRMFALTFIFTFVIYATSANADTMSHWAYIRDEYGNALGIASEGDYVTVNGWEANGRISVYDANTGISGSIAPVYLYGGTDYQYENPGLYSYENPGTYDNYYQEFDYNYEYDQYYTGLPSYDYNIGNQYQDETYDYIYYEELYQSNQDPDQYYEETFQYYEDTSYYPYTFEAPTYDYGTYVDIDINTQTISVYKDGQKVLSSFCVTGNAGVTDTPVGIHYIMNKEENATLRGNDYEAQVSYWMPFTASGCGIHDATWRYDFSSGAYMGNGSHGCVNTSLGDASQIYNLVDVGTPVIVHR